MKYILHRAVIDRIYIEVTIKWTEGHFDDGVFRGPGAEITDYRAPGHPEVNWEWVDSHASDILATLPLSDT